MNLSTNVEWCVIFSRRRKHHTYSSNPLTSQRHQWKSGKPRHSLPMPCLYLASRRSRTWAWPLVLRRRRRRVWWGRGHGWWSGGPRCAWWAASGWRWGRRACSRRTAAAWSTRRPGERRGHQTGVSVEPRATRRLCVTHVFICTVYFCIESISSKWKRQ